MFDPFKDFESAGYLRNVRKDKDAEVIKSFEHNIFRANLPDALEFLAGRKVLTYDDFLAVHRLLFSDYYPWAGMDRSVTFPSGAVRKGDIYFAHPNDVRRAVDEGLRLGQSNDAMNRRPGEIMGLFAFGHPFLDGNGRTMLLVHLELSYRANLGIAWGDTNKLEYLDALTKEIGAPGKGILDGYLLRFKRDRLERNDWGRSIEAMRGLDGLDDDNHVDGKLSDPAVADRYRDFERQREYAYDSNTTATCSACGANPCVCGGDGAGGGVAGGQPPANRRGHGRR